MRTAIRTKVAAEPFTQQDVQSLLEELGADQSQVQFRHINNLVAGTHSYRATLRPLQVSGSSSATDHE